MTIHEPTTLATDYLLAIFAAALAGRLRLADNAAAPAVRWWARALSLTALSAVIGGSFHGFARNWPALERPWWTLTLLLVCLVGSAMDFARLHEVVPPPQRRTWRVLLGLKLLVFSILAFVHPKFFVAILAYGLSLLAWLGAALAQRRPWRSAMLAAIGCSLLAAAVQLLRLSPAPAFNHNDLYHVIQAVALFWFYRAARLMGAPPPVS